MYIQYIVKVFIVVYSMLVYDVCVSLFYIYTCFLYVQHPCYRPWILWHGVAFAFTAAPFGGDLYNT